MSDGRRPPDWLSALLRLIPDSLERETLAGDLEEGFRARSARSRAHAVIWYGSQAVRSIAVRILAGRSWKKSLHGGLGADLRDVIRGLRARPALVAVIAATLGIGLGVNTAMLSIADAVLFRPLPYPDPQGLVWIHAAAGEGEERFGELSHQDLERLRDAAVGLTTGAGYSPAGRTGTGGGIEAMELDFARVTEGFFETLGVGFSVGRGFTPEEAREGLPRLVLSHDFWQEHLAGSPDVLDRRIEIRGEPYTVVGVASPEARFPAGAAFWRPLDPIERADDDRELRVVGRIPEGGLEEVNLRLRSASSFVVPPDDVSLTLWAEPLRATLVRGAQTPILLLLGGAGLVLFIACANVANLLLARGTERRRELAMRAALGASPRRLARLQFLETALLSTLGAVAAFLAALAGLPALVAMAPEGTPRILEASLDFRVLGGMVLLVMVTTVLAGAVPSLFARSLHPLQVTDDRTASPGGSGSRLSRRLLVVGQVALSTVLCVGAGLLLTTLHALTQGDPGFDPRGVVTVELYPTREAVASRGGRVAYHRAVLSSVSTVHGIESAAIGSQPPSSGRGYPAGLLRLSVAGTNGRPVEQAGVVEVGPRYFQVNDISLHHGRVFTEEDGTDAPRVAVVNREAARRYLAAEPARAIGRRLTGLGIRGEEPSEIQVVGVVDDAQPDPRVPPAPLIYLPMAQLGIANGVLHVRVDGDPVSVIPLIRRELNRIDPELPVNRVHLLQDTMQAIRASPSFVARVLVGFGGLALLLALLGSYSVMAHGVSRRRSELGIRRALGAGRHRVVLLVAREGVSDVVVGLLVGVAVSLGASGLLQSLVFGVEPTEPAVYAGVAGAVGVAGFLACWLPARRAARVDPMTALRRG